MAVPPVAPDSLAQVLHRDRVPWETLEHDYGSLLKLVSVLLGLVPNCDRYLEIWPPAFRTYNVMVPNFLNLPAPVFGIGAPGNVIGLGMYVASRAAECPYCSAHTCSFALRRGASATQMARALVAEDANFAEGELATVAVARSLARIPCELTAAERDELIRVYGPAQAEWIVLAIVMMGFLNKFMNAIDVELEEPVVAEVSDLMGSGWNPGAAWGALPPSLETKPPPPADRLATKLRLLSLLPGVIRLDRRWQKGVPKGWPEVGSFLRERTGHDFAVLSRLRHTRAVRAVATMLKDNLDPATTLVGLDVKVLAGAIFARAVGDDRLAEDIRALAARHGVTDAQVAVAATFAGSRDAPPPDDDPRRAGLLLLSRAASPSPAKIDAAIVAACSNSGLTSAEIVELVCWLSLLQMLHRLTCFYSGA